jgi:hypothetical protein
MERLLLAVCVVAAAGLAVLTYSAWRDYRDSRPVSSGRPAPTPTVSVRAVEFTQPQPASTREVAPRLVLTAARGESWVAVRAGSETGASLYEGTLAQGDRLSYRRNRLWVRLGLPVNVDATIDGKPAPLPGGIATVMLRGGRLTPAASG